MEKQIEAIIKEAGKIMLSARYENMMVDEKEGNANFVTEYDVKVQNFLEEKFLKLIPSASFLAEEGGEDENKVGEGYTFIIDPIDGTTNFLYNMSRSAISVAIAKDGEVIFGAIFNPYTDEYFHAKKGEGAYLNGKKIHVSEAENEKALAIIGTAPYYKETIGEKTVELFKELYFNFGDVRRSGSAAIDFCDIARGSASVFFEYVLSPWDYAAGALIVKEAGGVVSDFSGNALEKFEKSTVVAGSKKGYPAIIEICSKIY